MADYGTTHGELKPLAEVATADPRFRIMVIENEDGIRSFDLADLHRRLSDSVLIRNAPPDVRTSFETARNLLFFTWFVYEFQTVAEMQAYGALELALRSRRGRRPNEKRWPSLARLLDEALVAGWFDAAEPICHAKMARNRQWYEQFYSEPAAASPLPSREWFRRVVAAVPDQRNHIAHGNPKLYLNGAFDCLEFCATLINSLFSTAID